MRRLAIALLAVLVLAAVAAGGLLWRASMAPVSLAWLQPQIMKLVARSTPFAITFTDPSIGWEPGDNLLVLRVRDFEARAEDGQLVATAPLLRGTVALGPLLLERRIALVDATIDLPRMALARGADGRLRLLFDDKLAAVPLGQTAGDGGVDALLGDAPGGTDPRLASIRRVEIRAPVLEYQETATNARIAAEDAVFDLVHDDAGWSASLGADVGTGRITATAKPLTPAAELKVIFELQDLQPSLLADFVPTVPLAGLVLPVSGTVAMPLDPASGVPGAATVDLTGGGGEIASDKLGLAPLRLDGARLRGTIERGFAGAAIDELRLAGEGFVFAAKGTVSLAEAGTTADVTVDPDDLDVDEALRLWPTKVAVDTRQWVADNVPVGKLGHATFRMAPGGGRPGQQNLAGSLDFTGVQVRYLEKFPPAEGLTGQASLAGDSLTLTSQNGRSGEITLRNAQVTLANLMGAGVVRLQAKMDLASPLSAALRVLDAPPVELGKTTGISARQVGGQQSTRLTLGLPLVDPLPPERITFRAEARLQNLEARDLPGGYTVASDRLDLVAQQTGVSGKGAVRVNGVPLTVDFTQTDKPGRDKVTRRISASGQLDQAGVQRLGQTWPAQLGGSVGVNLLVTEQSNAVRTADVTLDLARTTANVPELQLTKAAGQAGTFLAKLTQVDPNSLTVDLARLNIPGWTVEGHGSARLDPLAPQQIELTQARTPLGDLTLTLFQQRGVWRGHVDIGSMDVRPLMAGSGSGGGGALPDMALAVSARSLRLGETPLSKVIASFEHTGGQWRTASLRGAIQGSDLSLDLTPAERNARLAVRGSDAGWVMRAVSDSDHGVRGGTFRLDATLNQSGSRLAADGDLKIRNFTMWGAPTIARIVSLASISGLSNALSGRGVPITRLVVPFRLRNDVVTMTQARLVGSDIGVRADGTVDLARSRVDIRGTVAPLYTINRTLGRIPILGSLMSGSRSDAFLAAGFSVTGPLAQPQVSANPLSALVPGAIRDLFGGFDTDPNSAAD